jgi:signal transduction histidine kinase
LRNFTVTVPDVEVDVDFAVQSAESGEEALALISREPPHVLLLDHKMPGLSGLEVMEQTRELQGEMLTIMITAYASIETAITATKRGAYDFLTKPFTPDDLKATLRKAAVRIVLAEQARKMADEKRRVRFEFVRVLGHELKAPLGAVEGYLNLLRDRVLGDDVAAYDEMIHRSKLRIEGMRKLVSDLLDLTRIESGEKHRQLERVDVRQVAELAVETYASSAAERNITLAIHADSSVPLQADRGELDMILNNLLSNAVKYNREGGRVDVTLGRQDDEITIAVADTGIGMTAAEAEKLFGEFVRIRNAKTANILGSGLGLSIVDKLARLYGGRATVESQPDVGTTFRVFLNDTAGDSAAADLPAPGDTGG